MKLYDLKEVAEMLGVHYNSVYRWVATDKILKGFKLTRNWKVREEDLNKFLEERMKASE